MNRPIPEKPSLSILLPLSVAGLLFVAACGSGEGEAAAEAQPDTAQTAAANTLTTEEQETGWQLLFDGETLDGWTGLGRDTLPEGHWQVEEGAIRKVESGDVPTAPDGQPLEGGDLMTEEAFRDFELAWEWRVEQGSNSGLKYNVSEDLSATRGSEHSALGFEYQVLDDERHPDGEEPSHRSGALYDMIPPDTSAKQLSPPGEWNRSRLVFRGNHGEHWLNGEKMLDYDLDTARFDSLLEASKYSDIEGFADRRAGHIVLQDHSDNVWFRNIKIRDLAEAAGGSR